MSETECRHLPRPVWNPARCAKCGAILERSANARLTWSTERPTVPGWYWLRGVSWFKGVPGVTMHRLEDVPESWRVEFAGPIPEPAEPAPETLA